MNRRRFIKQAMKIAVAIGVIPALPVDKAFGSFSGSFFTTEPFHVVGKNIHWTGHGKSRYTLLEFHQWLQRQAEQVELSYTGLDISSQNPSIRRSPHMIALVNGYEADAEVIEHLTEGTLTQGDDVFTAFFCYGDEPSEIIYQEGGKL